MVPALAGELAHVGAVSAHHADLVVAMASAFSMLPTHPPSAMGRSFKKLIPA